MSPLQFFTIVAIFLSITSVRTSTVSYEDIPLVFSNIPRLIYTAESNPTFSGYSYATQDFNGGGSNVVFTTGADSVNRLKNEMYTMKVSEKYPQRDMPDRTEENSISSGEESKSEEIGANMNKQDLDSNVRIHKGEMKPSKYSEADNNFVQYQAPLRQISLDASYPAFRANLLNFDPPAVLPGYQISSNVIQNQYHSHNPYARLELPLSNFNFYNPAVPLFYQTAVSIPANFERAPIIAEDVKTSTESSVAKSLQNNTTASKSDVTESRFNQESMTNAIIKTLNKSDVHDKLESMTIEKNKGEIMNGESVNPPATSESSVEKITDGKINENTSTEVSPSTEKSNTATPDRCRRCAMSQ